MMLRACAVQVKELYAHLEPSDTSICTMIEGVWGSTITSVKKMRVFATTKVRVDLVCRCEFFH
jgi:hypothetical protein